MRSFVLSALFILAVGCSSEVPVVPPSHNRTFMDTQGKFLGHLKPEPGPPLGPDGSPIVAADPVVWVIEGDRVSEPEHEWDAETFRLDFNEKESLTEAILPWPLMTKETRQVAIHRGPPPPRFSHSGINGGAPLLPVYRCGNPDCPRVQAIDNYALFPIAEGEPKPHCPFCESEDVEPFVTPQHQNMREFMERNQSASK